MKKIMSLILALTMILSVGSLMASAAATEVTNATTAAPVNYASASGVTIKTATSNSNKVLTTADMTKILSDDDNATFTDNNSAEVSVSAGAMNNTSRTLNNVWFMVTLPQEQPVSAIVVDQWKNRIDEYRVFATSNDTIANEIKSVNGIGLSEKGKKHDDKKDDSKDITYTTDGIIDRLIQDGALVASGALNGDNALSIAKNTIVFNNEKKAKYIIFVIDSVPQAAYSSGVMIDYIEVLGKTEKSSTDFAQFPETYTNYANKSVYPGVSAIRTSAVTDVAANGVPDTLVNPNSTAISNSFNAVLTVIPSLQKSGATLNENSWFGIDLGTERTFDKIDIYQYNNRMKTVSVYSANAEQFAAAQTDDKELDDSIISGLTLLKTGDVSIAGKSTSEVLGNSKGALTTPGTINLESEAQARYLIFVVRDSLDKYKGMPVVEVHVMGSEPSIQQTNAYPAGGLDYTVKFANDAATIKKFAIVEAQYNEADEMIANNIKYVNIEPLYAKSFAGKIEKVDGAKTIKVFSWCLDELKPLETEYTFNIQ